MKENLKRKLKLIKKYYLEQDSYNKILSKFNGDLKLEKELRRIEIINNVLVGSSIIAFGTFSYIFFRPSKSNNNVSDGIQYHTQYDNQTIKIPEDCHYVFNKVYKNELDTYKNNVPEGYKIYSITDIENSDYVNICYVNTVAVMINLSDYDSNNSINNSFGKATQKELNFINQSDN